VRDRPPHELKLEDYERFLDRWVRSKPSTLASGVSLVRGFSRFLYERGYAAEFIAEPLKRPKRQAAEDLEVVTISASDVGRMLDTCEDWQELLCVATGRRSSGLPPGRESRLMCMPSEPRSPSSSTKPIPTR